MTNDIKAKVAEVDSIIRKQSWFDFHVLSYNESKLVVAGGIDLSYYHTLEIIFENVFFVSGIFKEWRSDTSAPVFMLPENEMELNKQFEIEQGYQLFIIRTDDHHNNFIVAAEKLSFNTDTVFYYNRSDLKENERIVGFVKKDEGITKEQ